MTLIKVHCKLKRCNKLFMQSRDWQKFCCKEHQRESWNERYKDRYNLSIRDEKQEEKIYNK